MIPAIIHLVLMQKNRIIKYLSIGLIFISVLYGISSFIQRSLSLSNNPKSALGFRHEIIDNETLEYIKSQDAKLSRSVFYLTSPEIGLEISRNTTILSHADFESLDVLKNRTYKGRSENLLVVLQKRFSVNGKQQAILNSFIDYSSFSVDFENEHFVVFIGK
jgi:hypothetical protein